MDYDYRFIEKGLAKEFEKQLTCLEEKTEKYLTFTVAIEKEVARSDKNGDKITKIYLKDYNLLIAQNILQAHYQILSITFLEKFTKLHVNTDTMIKNVKFAELSKDIATGFLSTQTLKMI